MCFYYKCPFFIGLRNINGCWVVVLETTYTFSYWNNIYFLLFKRLSLFDISNLMLKIPLKFNYLGSVWRKIWFCIPYKTHSGSNKHGSISFMINYMHYVILRIWEQDAPWCSEIQNKRLEVLGNTFNLHSNSTLRPTSVVSQSVSKEE